MGPHQVTVPIDLGTVVGTVYFQEITPGFRQVNLIDGFCVIANTPVIISAAILSVDCIPGMGQVDPVPLFGHGCRALGGLLGEGPFGIKVKNFTHEGLLLSAFICFIIIRFHCQTDREYACDTL